MSAGGNVDRKISAENGAGVAARASIERCERTPVGSASCRAGLKLSSKDDSGT
jgi:hypothetical protein